MRLTTALINLRCDYCKSIVYNAPDADGIQYLGENGEMPCPVCLVPLWEASRAGIPFRSCKRCHGILIAMKSFVTLIEQARAEQHGAEMPVADDESDLDRKLACPSCHRAMETHFYYGGGHVVMEDCERCELNWLDAGALMRIACQPHAQETPSF